MESLPRAGGYLVHLSVSLGKGSSSFPCSFVSDGISCWTPVGNAGPCPLCTSSAELDPYPYSALYPQRDTWTSAKAKASLVLS